MQLLINKTPFLHCGRAMAGYLREGKGFKVTGIQPLAVVEPQKRLLAIYLLTTWKKWLMLNKRD